MRDDDGMDSAPVWEGWFVARCDEVLDRRAVRWPIVTTLRVLALIDVVVVA